MKQAILKWENNEPLVIEPDGTQTWVRLNVHGDFFVEQVRPDGKKAFFSTYSNSGTAPFMAFVKFLIINRVSLPAIPKPSFQTSKELEERCESEARTSMVRAFPYKIGAELSDRGGLERLSIHATRYGHEPRLEFLRENGEGLSFSIPLARAMVAIIPRIAGEGTGPYRRALAIIKNAVRKREYEKEYQSVIETRPRQKIIPGVKKIVRRKWEITKKLHNKPSQRRPRK